MLAWQNYKSSLTCFNLRDKQPSTVNIHWREKLADHLGHLLSFMVSSELYLAEDTSVVGLCWSPREGGHCPFPILKNKRIHVVFLFFPGYADPRT